MDFNAEIEKPKFVKPTKHVNKSVSALVLIMFVLVMGALVMYVFSVDTETILPSTRMVDVPTVSTRVIGSDGTAHDVDAQISIELSDTAPVNLDGGTIQRLVLDAVSELDYDKLQEPGNISYIQDQVINKISEYIPRGDIVGAYVSELQCGELRIASPPPAVSDTPSQRETTARRLFRSSGR